MAAIVRVVLERLRRSTRRKDRRAGDLDDAVGQVHPIRKDSCAEFNEAVGTVWTDVEVAVDRYHAKRKGYCDLMVFLAMFGVFTTTIYWQRGLHKIVDAEKPLRAFLNLPSDPLASPDDIYKWFNETLLPIWKNPACGDNSCDAPFESAGFWTYGCVADCGIVEDQVLSIVEFTTEKTLYQARIEDTTNDQWNICMNPFERYGDAITTRCLHSSAVSFGFDASKTFTDSDGKILVWSRFLVPLTVVPFHLSISAPVSVNVTGLEANASASNLDLDTRAFPDDATLTHIFYADRCSDDASTRRLDLRGSSAPTKLNSAARALAPSSARDPAPSPHRGLTSSNHVVIDPVLDKRRYVHLRDWIIPFQEANMEKALDKTKARSLFLRSVGQALLAYVSFTVTDAAYDLLFDNATVTFESGRDITVDPAPLVRFDFLLELFDLPQRLQSGSRFATTYDLRNDTDVRRGLEAELNDAVLDPHFTETVYFYIENANASLFTSDEIAEAVAFINGATTFGDCAAGVFEASIGDGRCNPELNTAECGAYDGGDCCEITCEGDGAYACGSKGYDCRDPLGSCEFLALRGDGECNLPANTLTCGWDGGDCCSSTCDHPDCGEHEFICSDPEAVDSVACSIPSYKGDAYCDYDGPSDLGTNTFACDWDGGDCCPSSCIAESGCFGSSPTTCLDEAIAPFYRFTISGASSQPESTCSDFTSPTTGGTCGFVATPAACLLAAKANGAVPPSAFGVSREVSDATLPQGCFFGEIAGHSSGDELFFNTATSGTASPDSGSGSSASIVTFCDCPLASHGGGASPTDEPADDGDDDDDDDSLFRSKDSSSGILLGGDVTTAKGTQGQSLAPRFMDGLSSLDPSEAPSGGSSGAPSASIRRRRAQATVVTAVNVTRYTPIGLADLSYTVGALVDTPAAVSLLEAAWADYLLDDDVQEDFDMAPCTSASSNVCSSGDLGDLVCKEACNIKACAFDFGDCSSSAPFVVGDTCMASVPGTSDFFLPSEGCFVYHSADNICDPQCDFEACNRDNGACCVEVDASGQTPITHTFEAPHGNTSAYPFPDPDQPLRRSVAGNHLLLQGVLISVKLSKEEECAKATMVGNLAESLEGSAFWVDKVPETRFDERYGVMCRVDSEHTEPHGYDPVFVSSTALYAAVNNGTLAVEDYYGPSARETISDLPFGFNYTRSRSSEVDKYDGFHVFFDINFNEAWAENVLAYAQQGDLIASTASEVRFSYVTFSPQLKVFALNEVIFTFEESGEISTEGSNTDAFRIQLWDDDLDFWRYWAEILFIICVTMQWLIEAHEAYRDGWGYIYNGGPKGSGFAIWNAVDITNLVLFTYMIFTQQLYLYSRVEGYLPALRHAVYDRINRETELGANWLGHAPSSLQNVMEDLEEASWYSEYWRHYMNVAGAALLLMIFRLLKMLHFQPTLGVVTRTIVGAAEALVSWSVVFASTNAAFAFMGHLLFGSYIEELSTLGRALDSTFQMLTMVWLPDLQNEEKAPELLAIWTYSHILISFFILLNVLLAILVESYLEVKDDAEKDQTPGEDMWQMARNAVQQIHASDEDLTVAKLTVLAKKYARFQKRDETLDMPMMMLDEGDLFVDGNQLGIMLALELDDIMGTGTSMDQASRDRLAEQSAQFICAAFGRLASVYEKKYDEKFTDAIERLPVELRAEKFLSKPVIQRVIEKAKQARARKKGKSSASPEESSSLMKVLKAGRPGTGAPRTGLTLNAAPEETARHGGAQAATKTYEAMTELLHKVRPGEAEPPHVSDVAPEEPSEEKSVGVMRASSAEKEVEKDQTSDDDASANR